MYHKTYENTTNFKTKEEALAHMEMFEYTRLPVPNRWSTRFCGDYGEPRISFAHIEAVDEGGTVTGYRVHEVEMPLERRPGA